MFILPSSISIYLRYPTARRRSNVVKQVDKIKQDREARRAKQAAVKEERVRDVDLANNPNWEFLQMIREYKEELDFNPLTNADQVSYDPPLPLLFSPPPPPLVLGLSRLLSRRRGSEM